MESEGESGSSPEGDAGAARYKKELLQFTAGVDELRRSALTGALRTSRLRSVAWAVLLGALPPEPELWTPKLRLNRERYEIIRQKHGRDPRRCGRPEDDPLSQNDGSVWNQHFADTELRSTIQLDVVRTFPRVEFFRLPDVQEAMTDVLFCYARETPQLLYRQGMHEILAPLLFVLQCDHRAAEHSTPGDELSEILDPQYLEHDAYALFSAIMYGVEKFYRVDETPPLSPNFPESEKDSDLPPERKRIEVEVVRYLNDIRDNLLSQHDLELAEHLQKCDISLSLFGVRWLRVLFGREFTLHDLLVLWDAMFAEDEDFSLAGFILVSMLIAIRMPLLHKDPMVCLTYLMHYPTTIDVQYIIEHALYLKHSDQYCLPIPRSFNLTLPKATAMMLSRKSIHKRQKNKQNAGSKLKVGTSADDNEVVDGITLRDWENLTDELFHAHSVMSLCSLKLEKYEEIIRQSLPPTLHTSHPTYQALSGINELCRLLQTRHQKPPDIEPAFEANEFSPDVAKDKKKLQKNKEAINALLLYDEVPSKISSPKEVQLKVFNLVKSNEVVIGAPSLDPLGIHID